MLTTLRGQDAVEFGFYGTLDAPCQKLGEADRWTEDPLPKSQANPTSF